MRVIAGSAKGHRLKAPKRTATRPATDLVKGSIFSILENITDNWEYVLDLYSGSGGLGIEALSRGAGWVDFVDHAPQCCAIIKENLDKTKLSEYARVHCSTVNIHVKPSSYNFYRSRVRCKLRSGYSFPTSPYFPETHRPVKRSLFHKIADNRAGFSHQFTPLLA